MLKRVLPQNYPQIKPVYRLYKINFDEKYCTINFFSFIKLRMAGPSQSHVYRVDCQEFRFKVLRGAEVVGAGDEAMDDGVLGGGVSEGVVVGVEVCLGWLYR